MGHLTSGRGVVVVVRLRRRNQARCTCGWIGKASLLLSSAKVDALLHAAREDCEPGIPLCAAGGSCAHQVFGRPQGRQHDGPDARGLTRRPLFGRPYLCGMQRSVCRLHDEVRCVEALGADGFDDGSRSTSTTILNHCAQRAPMCRSAGFQSFASSYTATFKATTCHHRHSPVRVARGETRLTIVKYCYIRRRRSIVGRGT